MCSKSKPAFAACPHGASVSNMPVNFPLLWVLVFCQTPLAAPDSQMLQVLEKTSNAANTQQDHYEKWHMDIIGIAWIVFEHLPAIWELLEGPHKFKR